MAAPAMWQATTPVARELAPAWLRSNHNRPHTTWPAPLSPVAAVERSEAAYEDAVLAKPGGAFYLASYGSAYISVAAVTATIGSALTAGHFGKPGMPANPK